jgi:SAM-dependent methyltransferase
MKPETASFDAYARDYESALNQGLSVSGEDRGYFARGRIGWLARCLEQLDYRPTSAVDYGCGTGSSLPLFAELLGVKSAIGIDVSRESLEVARQQYGSPAIRFSPLDDFQPGEEIDLVYCNGVFHHIPPADRLDAVRFIHKTLRPGGIFALWENNPWNPGTRWVMSRIPFDRDAITLTGRQARQMLAAGRFEVLRTDYCFIFPAVFRFFRFIEPCLSRLPVGAQYQVLCRKREV